MKKKMALLVACAAGSAIGSFTTAVRAGTFVDDFTSGSVTAFGSNPNFWSTGTYQNPTTGATITESVGGPLTLGYDYTGAGSPPAQDGSYIYGPLEQEFNPFAQPLLLTMTAPAGGNLIPSADNIDADTAYTYLSVNGNGQQRSDYGSSRITLILGNTGDLQFVIKDSTNAGSGGATTYSVTNRYYASTPTESTTGDTDNIIVSSIYLYVDGTNYASGVLNIDFGETYYNTTTGTTGTYSFDNTYLKLPTGTYFDLGPAAGSAGGNKTQTQLDNVEAGFVNGGSVGMEVMNTPSNYNEEESVPVIQLTDINPPPPVPEPASLGIAAVGAGLLLRRRR